MSKTLNLCEYLLYEGRRYSALGVDRRALRSFAHLIRLRDLSPEIAEETQICLAELSLKQRKFAKARRHLTAALAHSAANPVSHYLIATAHAEDPRGDRGLALYHYRQCLHLDPENAQYHCDAGLFALNFRRTREGICWLNRAAELAPDDAEILEEVIRGLQEYGRRDEAQILARSAFFRNHRNPRFQRLWHDFAFRQLEKRQCRLKTPQPIRRTIIENKVSLPFLKLTIETPTGRKLVRQDGPSGPPKPHLPRIARLSDQMHA
jgi:tetratricopeptide (TPR) repeat protein